MSGDAGVGLTDPVLEAYATQITAPACLTGHGAISACDFQFLFASSSCFLLHIKLRVSE